MRPPAPFFRGTWMEIPDARYCIVHAHALYWQHLHAASGCPPLRTLGTAAMHPWLLAHQQPTCSSQGTALFEGAVTTTWARSPLQGNACPALALVNPFLRSYSCTMPGGEGERVMMRALHAYTGLHQS